MKEDTSDTDTNSSFPNLTTMAYALVGLPVFARFAPRLFFAGIDESDSFYPLTQDILELTQGGKAMALFALMAAIGLALMYYQYKR